MDLFRTDCIKYVSIFEGLKKREWDMFVSWILRGLGYCFHAPQSGMEQGCVQRMKQTYCMDEQGPGPRPRRCSQDDPSKRRIQISPATYRVGVNFAEVVVGIHHRKLPSPQTLLVSASIRTTRKRLYKGHEGHPGHWLGFFKQSKKLTLWWLTKEESATWNIFNGFQN